MLTGKGIRLVATETQKMGDADVHRELLGHGVVMLEGVDLTNAPDGKGFLCAQPLKLGGSEGRAHAGRDYCMQTEPTVKLYYEDSHLSTCHAGFWSVLRYPAGMRSCWIKPSFSRRAEVSPAILEKSAELAFLMYRKSMA